jgi:hypothetical protein
VRHSGGGYPAARMPSRRNEIEMSPEIRAMAEKQARKRIGLHFVPTRVVSWDHRKLGGVY